MLKNDILNQDIYEYIGQIVPPEDVMRNEPLKKHTTYRVGGEAEVFIKISQKEQLLRLVPFLKRLEIDFFVLGNGSNVLASDKGYRGVVLQIGDQMSTVNVDGNRITAQSGALLSKVAAVAMEHSLTGMEFASGIPGTVGGGIMMNAGAYGGEMAQVTESVLIMDEAGELMKLNHDTMEFGYRTSVVKNRPYIVLEAELILQPGNAEEIRYKMNRLATERREKQPLEYPSAGSTFKRPDGHYAGKLIMDAGLRGFRIGGACVSEKHCGFVINRGNATAADILEVIKEVQDRVYERFDVTLEQEVVCLGEF